MTRNKLYAFTDALEKNNKFQAFILALELIDDHPAFNHELTQSIAILNEMQKTPLAENEVDDEIAADALALIINMPQILDAEPHNQSLFVLLAQLKPNKIQLPDWIWDKVANPLDDERSSPQKGISF